VAENVQREATGVFVPVGYLCFLCSEVNFRQILFSETQSMRA